MKGHPNFQAAPVSTRATFNNALPKPFAILDHVEKNCYPFCPLAGPWTEENGMRFSDDVGLAALSNLRGKTFCRVPLPPKRSAFVSTP